MMGFIVICDIIILILLGSMIYSMAKLGEEFRQRCRRLSQNIAYLENRIMKLEKGVKEEEEDDNN